MEASRRVSVMEMRPPMAFPAILAACGVLAFALIAAAAAAAAPAPAPAAAPAPSATPRPTAGPPGSFLGTGIAPERPNPWRARLVTGFVLPIAGARLPQADAFLPDSAREYRAGWHEGIDFPAPAGAPVLAARAGVVIRIDHGFSDWTPAELEGALTDARALGHTPAAVLDRIRGRQVWIDHGGGIVTRYAHLSSVAPIPLHGRVTAGTVIGTVGSSGFPPGGPHLHFEIRVGDVYLGEGLTPRELARALRLAFD